MPLAEEALAQKRRAIARVKLVPSRERSFDNTVLPLEFSSQRLSASWGIIELLLNASPDTKVRAEAKKASDYLQDQLIALEYDEGLYRALCELEQLKPRPSGEDKKLFQDMLRGYRRMGLNLPNQKREVVRNKFQELAKLGSDFRKNINDHQDYILVTANDLAGLPASYINGLSMMGEKYKISLDYPELRPFMQYAKSRKKREELSVKALRKGGVQNISVLKKLVRLRDEIANLLGYKSHADSVLEVKMAGDTKTVFKFLNDLARPLKKTVRTELQGLERILKEQEGKQAKLSHFDIAYLINQDKQRRFKVDDHLIKEYFPLQTVTEGMLSIYEKLFGVKFKKQPAVKAWHPDAVNYAVYNRGGKEPIGYFFLDLYPREGKYGHAAVFPVIPAWQMPGGDYNKPVVAMLCNFAKPTKSHPSLLSHDEVETYFHEFGHVVHGVLTTAKYGSQSGTSVQRDFVEAPSQMLENWVWDEKMLKILSGHYKKSSEKLPKKLLSALVGTKMHMSGYFWMRQLVFGLFDMNLHTSTKLAKDPVGLYAKLTKELIGLDLPKSQLFPAGFGHLEGYDAGYYGYLWSKAFSADMFTRFQKEGLLNPKTGKDYRTHILAPGSSREAMDLLKGFLGRKPNNKAFLKELGL